MPPGNRRRARGLTCTGANNITVPLYSRKCSTKPKKLTITVNSDEAVIIEFRENMTGKEMRWQKEPIDREKEGQNSSTTGDGKLILPLDTSKESGFYSFTINDAVPSTKLDRYCTVVVIRRGKNSR
ncbi:uncharacterized protein LOC135215243 [Macrobrachium nipponense]|uniref:uncharacterized protein LOC135215243 n=1 Tax=Macrobrachium nipponense TaxID=159736 RepID=UPI0030C8AAF7